jgi:hypothetical protein
MSDKKPDNQDHLYKVKQVSTAPEPLKIPSSSGSLPLSPQNIIEWLGHGSERKTPKIELKTNLAEIRRKWGASVCDIVYLAHDRHLAVLEQLPGDDPEWLLRQSPETQERVLSSIPINESDVSRFETENPELLKALYSRGQAEKVSQSTPCITPLPKPEANQGQIHLPGHITTRDLDIMREAAPELETLWGEIRPILRYRESDMKYPVKALKDRAKKFFVEYEEGHDTKWKRLRIEFLEDDSLYDFQRLGNEKEDFIGRLHQKILLKDNPIRRRKPGVQTLNDIHLSILGWQPTKDQN